MVIEKKEILHFEDLSAGDVFTWHGNYYIRTSSNSSSEANAVDIQTGQPLQFGFNVNIEPVNGYFKVI